MEFEDVREEFEWNSSASMAADEFHRIQYGS